ncbi:ubiquitin-specific protease ubp1 [Coniosporium tulheliwenetii]|uniref:Ubiquitin-specific protease ubp1 n=1 Tax=Coniosporium tulheliwenetii TaxID=3383036 RepID=A0ACC2YQP7_9PEZI|nr:ubiquitin-specific protease ubp1 [Cladosporium sp. JES 115]
MNGNRYRQASAYDNKYNLPYAFDYKQEQSTVTLGNILAVLVLAVLAIYQLPPLRAFIWNFAVTLMPSRLVFALDRARSSGRGMKTVLEAPRRVFSLSGPSVLKSVAGDRSLRTISTLIKGTNSETPPGLGNWDNSCYQNSVIQGLASLHSLNNFLAKITSEYDGLLDASVTGALRDTITMLNDPSNHGQRLWTPAKLKSMNSWQQQDAQEYFSKILEEVDKEVLRASRLRGRISGLESLQEIAAAGDPTSIGAENHSQEEAANDQIFQNPLEGLLAQRVGCIRCGYSEGLSMIPFNCLTLPLGRDYTYDIRDCLDEYTKLEPIEGVECAKCTLKKTQEHLGRILQSATTGGSPMPDALLDSIRGRLATVQQALDEEDFEEKTLVKKCQILKKNWVSTTKSRQAVVGRAPRSLVLHINRSVFDEYSGAQRKNYADVRFLQTLDLGPWCLGATKPTKVEVPEEATEQWIIDPKCSMLGGENSLLQLPYELRAVITHYGHHENGHYICYRKHPYKAPSSEISGAQDDEKDTPEERKAVPPERWWCLSDDDVSQVTEEDVLRQGGVFMLFYERMEPPSGPPIPNPTDCASSVSLESTSETVAPVPVSEDVEEPEAIVDTAPLPILTAADPPSTLPVVFSETEPSISPINPSTSPETTLAPPETTSTPLTQSDPIDEPALSEDTPSTAPPSDDEADTDPRPQYHQSEAARKVSNALLMRTASPTSRVRGEESMTSPLRMVAAT